jgi:DNA-binding SARP family transcriptional activator
MEFRILGPLEVRDGDGVVPIRRPKHRALLAALLLHAGEAVSVDQLLDDLWGEQPPPTAKGSLQNGVSALRKVLGGQMLRSNLRATCSLSSQSRLTCFASSACSRMHRAQRAGRNAPRSCEKRSPFGADHR